MDIVFGARNQSRVMDMVRRELSVIVDMIVVQWDKQACIRERILVSRGFVGLASPSSKHISSYPNHLLP